jgi:hypothetical protein
LLMVSSMATQQPEETFVPRRGGGWRARSERGRQRQKNYGSAGSVLEE